VSARFAFIRAHASEHAIRRLSRLLAVSKAGYYAWAARQRHGPAGLRARALANRQLAEHIRRVHQASRATYGSPRIHAELQAAGIACSRKRIARLMRLEQLKAKTRRPFRRTTDSAHPFPVAPHLLARQFALTPATPSRAPNEVWAADYTFISTREGWLYLAVVLDLASRRVVGWAMRPRHDHALVLDALNMAVTHRRPPRGLLHHSDRGRQYASAAYRTRLAEVGITCSRSAIGDCWDNAVVESFFASLKTEFLEDAAWRTREEARAALFYYLEVWYNRQRRHSSLGYDSPVQFERRHFNVA
jgi:putative transposase